MIGIVIEKFDGEEELCTSGITYVKGESIAFERFTFKISLGLELMGYL